MSKRIGGLAQSPSKERYEEHHEAKHYESYEQVNEFLLPISNAFPTNSPIL